MTDDSTRIEQAIVGIGNRQWSGEPAAAWEAALDLFATGRDEGLNEERRRRYPQFMNDLEQYVEEGGRQPPVQGRGRWPPSENLERRKKDLKRFQRWLHLERYNVLEEVQSGGGGRNPRADLREDVVGIDRGLRAEMRTARHVADVRSAQSGRPTPGSSIRTRDWSDNREALHRRIAARGLSGATATRATATPEDARVQGLRDGIEEARLEGFAQGFAQGIKEGRRETQPPSAIAQAYPAREVSKRRGRWVTPLNPPGSSGGRRVRKQKKTKKKSKNRRRKTRKH